MNRMVSKELRNQAMAYAVPRVKKILRVNDEALKKVFKARLKYLKANWNNLSWKDRHRPRWFNLKSNSK